MQKEGKKTIIVTKNVFFDFLYLFCNYVIILIKNSKYIFLNASKRFYFSFL